MLRVHLVGSMRVWLDGDVVEPPSSRRAWALLAWLALHPGLHARAGVAATFWPDVLDACARASLRSAVWALRLSLGPAAPTYLHLDRQRIGLRDDAPVDLDVARLAALRADGRLLEAAALGTGDLLAELDDEWAVVARDAFRHDLADLFEAIAQDAEAHGDLTSAIAWTHRQAGLDPLAEAPQRRLMRRLVAGGNRAAALRTYARLRERLARDLGIAPDHETVRLAEDLHAAAVRV